MRVAIVDYQSGNLHSAAKAFERASRDSDANATIAITADPSIIRQADQIVLPGVGAFGDCARGVTAADGVVEALREAVLTKGRPFLGICVGMQLLADRGLEHGTHDGLGWIGGEVRLVTPRDHALKVPHLGWNTLSFVQSHPLFDGIPDGNDGWHAYFVHSYQFAAVDSGSTLATTDYGGAITAAVARGNMIGTQFHPEKSQKLGLKLIANFLKWRP